MENALRNPWVLGAGASLIVIALLLSRGGGSGGNGITAASLGSANSTNVALAQISGGIDAAAMAHSTALAGISADLKKTGIAADAQSYAQTLGFLNTQTQINTLANLKHEETMSGITTTILNNAHFKELAKIAAAHGEAIAPILADEAKAIAAINANASTTIAQINATAQQNMASMMAMLGFGRMLGGGSGGGGILGGLSGLFGGGSDGGGGGDFISTVAPIAAMALL